MSQTMTQAQTDQAVVQGWIDSAKAAGEDAMVPFYERILAALLAVSRRASPSRLPLENLK